MEIVESLEAGLCLEACTVGVGGQRALIGYVSAEANPQRLLGVLVGCSGYGPACDESFAGVKAYQQPDQFWWHCFYNMTRSSEF